MTTAAERVRSQAGYEARTLLANGEQLLVSLVLPAMALFGLHLASVPDLGPRRIDVIVPGVLALAVVVAAVSDGPIGRALAEYLPHDPTLLGLLTVAAVAAVISNLVNNLPATLLLLAAIGTHAPPAVILAVLLGVNIGPNLTYVGSLANLLWRGVVRRDMDPSFAEFSRVGLVTTPLTLVAAVVALWAGLELIGA